MDLFSGLCTMGGIWQLLDAKSCQPVSRGALIAHNLRTCPVRGVETASDTTVRHLERASL